MRHSYLFILIFSCLGCSMSYGHHCVEAKYYFSMTESFSPEKDSILLGDTLWVASSHSTTFLDSVTKTEIDFSNSQLGTPFEVLKFSDASGNVIGAVNDFDYIAKAGTLAGKQKGIYGISLGDDISVTKKSKGCEKAYIKIENANSENHLYYYQNFRPGYVISDYERTHIYCFEVY